MADVDLFVIGGGSGGVACARRAASHGARVALAESDRVGGTCVIRGCVPKKLMSYGAHMRDLFEVAPAYGWETGVPAHDFVRLVANRNRETARLEGIYRGLLDRSGVRLLDGRARIAARVDDGFLVEVEGHGRVGAARVLLAVGAGPQLPDMPGRELAVTSDQLLEEVYERPERMVVIGGGYIGLEQASIFLGLGCETHLVIRRDLPLHGFDDDLRHALKVELEQRGLRVHANVNPEAIERTAGGALLVRLSNGTIEADKVLLATGRRAHARTRGIGLEELGVALDGTGCVKVDGDGRSSIPDLFAVGDCSDHACGGVGGAAAEELGLSSGEFDLTPVAIAEGRALAERLFNERNRDARVNYRMLPTAVFSIPQAASAGLSERRARRTGRYDVQVFMTTFRPMLYTLANLDGPARPERTMMKIVVDRATDRILGFHMVGDDAAEVIQSLAVALTAGVTKRQLDDTMALHPTAAEEFVTLYAPVTA